jgi:hypothetical protein
MRAAREALDAGVRLRARPVVLVKLLVLEGRYHYSRKIRDFIEDGLFEEVDLESCIRGATSIYKVEADDFGEAVDGCKYTILGRDRFRKPFYTCGKILLSEDAQRLYFFITAHEAN